MFPFIRLTKEILKFRKSPPLAIGDVHVSTHMCWPWDLDMAVELNNGRTLTLLDLARVPLFIRSGIWKVTARNNWTIAMAGVVVRYRRRIRAFERFTVESHFMGWDDRFIYVHQTIWKKNGDCANEAVYRVAVAGKDGIVSTDVLTRELGVDPAGPALPDWVNAWIAAETARPWPPERRAAD